MIFQVISEQKMIELAFHHCESPNELMDPATEHQQLIIYYVPTVYHLQRILPSPDIHPQQQQKFNLNIIKFLEANFQCTGYKEK